MHYASVFTSIHVTINYACRHTCSTLLAKGEFISSEAQKDGPFILNPLVVSTGKLMSTGITSMASKGTGFTLNTDPHHVT